MAQTIHQAAGLPPASHVEMLHLTYSWRGVGPQVARVFTVALHLGFMWGARVPGWNGLGAISGRKVEFEGHNT